MKSLVQVHDNLSMSLSYSKYMGLATRISREGECHVLVLVATSSRVNKVERLLERQRAPIFMVIAEKDYTFEIA